jgi:hypothetical protein
MEGRTTQGVWWQSSRAAAVAALAPTVLALFVCAHQLTLHGVLHGIVLRTESPNLGSGLALGRGSMPYSDFALAQPPGMTLLMLPFGWLHHFVAGSVVLPAARCVTCVVTVAAVYLAGFAARTYGVPSALLAGVFTAIYPFQFFSTSGVTAAPYALFFALLGVTVAFSEGRIASPGRVLAAGLLLGFACTIKPWAVLPALVFLSCALASERRREHGLRAVGGLVVGGGLPCALFILAAPSKFWQEVILTELPGHGTTSGPAKLATLLGFGAPSGFSHPNGLAVTVAVGVLAVVLGTCLLGRSSSAPQDYFTAFTAAALLLATLLPGDMSVQYGEFALPFIAIAVAVTVARLLSLVGMLGSTHSATDAATTATSALGVMFTASAVLVGSLGASAQGSYGATYANRHALIVRAQIDHHIPPASCAISDVPMLLVEANRDSEPPGCPVIVDPAGVLSIAKANPGIWRPDQLWISWAQIAHFVVVPPKPSDLPPGRDIASLIGPQYVVKYKGSHLTIYVQAL